MAKQHDQGQKAMVRPRPINVDAYIDNENGIYIGVRVTRELHGLVMAEKGRRQDRVTLQELAAEALVSQFIPEPKRLE